MKKQIKCSDCGKPIAVSGYECQGCCEHEPDADEGFMCLNCGKECAEDVMSAAYDRAKDIRKYGEE